MRSRLGLGFSAAVLVVLIAAQATAYQDFDGDGVEDVYDNCRILSNSSQVDSDSDGWGDVCDFGPVNADATGDTTVGGPDFTVLGGQFGSTTGGSADFTGDTTVGGPDFTVMAGEFGNYAGPSGLACASENPSGGECAPPLAILDPLIQRNFTTQPVTVRTVYNDLADESTLTLLLNGIPVTGFTPGANETTLSVGAAEGLAAGRNILTAFVESTDPTVSDPPNTENFPNLVRYRVFYLDDTDLDGIPDVLEEVSSIDTDGDGLLDSVEEDHPILSRTGVITIASVEPPEIMEGEAVAFIGTGLEAIDLPGEVLFDGVPAQAVILSSPGTLIVTAPSTLSGSSTAVTFADSTGTTVGATTVPISTAQSSTFKNLVLISYIRSQIFYDGFGQLFQSQVNIQLFLNMLTFGPDTRVLIDASKVPVATQPLMTPDLEMVLETFAGIPGGNAVTRLSGSITDSLLSNYGLLFILLADTAGIYSGSEMSAIEDWLDVPGNRLVIVSDSGANNQPHVAANLILNDIGANSLFDGTFLHSAQQEQQAYFTGGIFSDPPLTNNLSVLYYGLPGSILVGGGADLFAVAGVCYFGETGILDEFGFLVACQPVEGDPLPVLQANIGVSESLPTNAPDIQIEVINEVSVPVSTGTFVEIPVETSIAVSGSYTNANPNAIRVNGEVAALDLVNRTFSISLPYDSRTSALGVVAELEAPGITIADSTIIRSPRESLQTQFIVFQKPGGAPAIPAATLDSAQRVSGLELEHMCSTDNGVDLGLTSPPLAPTLSGVDADLTVTDALGFELVLTRDLDRSEEVENLVVNGEMPGGGDPLNLIPNPVAAGQSTIRVFVAGSLFDVQTVGGLEVKRTTYNQNTENQPSAFAEAFFPRPFLSDPGFDAIIMQSSEASQDLEGGALRIDRPVASSLTHELVHVAAAVHDSENEDPSVLPIAHPATSAPSIMNSFPYYRALNIPDTSVAECDDPLGSVDTLTVCRRILDGYDCAGYPDIQFTE